MFTLNIYGRQFYLYKNFSGLYNDKYFINGFTLIHLDNMKIMQKVQSFVNADPIIGNSNSILHMKELSKLEEACSIANLSDNSKLIEYFNRYQSNI